MTSSTSENDWQMPRYKKRRVPDPDSWSSDHDNNYEEAIGICVIHENGEISITSETSNRIPTFVYRSLLQNENQEIFRDTLVKTIHFKL